MLYFVAINLKKGAHLAGYTAQRLIAEQLKLGKITGLDPAGPYLRNLPVSNFIC